MGFPWLCLLIVVMGAGLGQVPSAQDFPVIFDEDEALATTSYCRQGCRYDRQAAGEVRALYWMGRDAVLFEDFGAGLVTRIWCTTGHGISRPLPEDANLVVEIDGRTVFAGPLPSFFAGDAPVFQPPYAYDRLKSSGGNVSLLPLAYRKHCRIRLTDAAPHMLWYQIHHRHVADPDRLAAGWPRQSQPNALLPGGRDPWPQQGRWIEESLTLQPGGRAVAQSLTGPNIVNAIELAIPADQRTGLRMLFSFDGKVRGYLTLAEWLGGDIASMPRLFTAIDENRIALYFPMPFWNKMQVQLADTSRLLDQPITLRVRRRVLDQAPRAGSGYLHVERQTTDPGQAPAPLQWTAMEGVGKWVATTLAMRNADDAELTFLEGDEWLFRDESGVPDHYGTGTEDFFAGGFYFRNRGLLPQLLHLPYYGLARHAVADDRHSVSMYRVMVHDAVPYAQRLYGAMELGPQGGLAVSAQAINLHYLRDGRGERMAVQQPAAGGPAAADAAAADLPWREQAVPFDDPGLALFLTHHQWLDKHGRAHAIDRDGDGRITYAEAAAVTGSLQLSRLHVKSLAGLEAFSGLRSLVLDDNGLNGDLQLRGFPKLKRLTISYQSQLLGLNLVMANLETLVIKHGTLKTLSLVETPNLTRLILVDLPQLDSAQSGLPRRLRHVVMRNMSWLPLAAETLRSLDIRGGLLAGTLDVSRWPQLRTLRLHAIPRLNGVRVVDHNRLQRLVMWGNPHVNGVEIKQVKRLHWLRLEHNPMLKRMWVQDAPKLTHVLAPNNALTRVSLAQLPKVKWLNLSHNQLASLPALATHRRLAGLHVSFNQLTRLPALPDDVAFLAADNNRLYEPVDHRQHKRLFYADYSHNQLRHTKGLLANATFATRGGHLLDLRGNPLDAEDCGARQSWRQRLAGDVTALMDEGYLDCEP